MNPVCIIPAISKNNDLKDKNMLYLGNKPISFYTIDAVLESKIFDRENIFFISENTKYLELVKTKNINVIKINEELTLGNDLIITDFLKNFDDEQVFMILEPNLPFRTEKDIINAYNLYLDGDCDSVVSYSSFNYNGNFLINLDKDNYINHRDEGNGFDLNKKLYYPNGAIHITTKSSYIKHGGFYSKNTKGYIMEETNSLSINSKTDFLKARGILDQMNIFNLPVYHAPHFKIYEENSNKCDSENIILGDSRMSDLKVEGFFNYGISGSTLDTCVKCMPKFLKNKVSKAIISIGINDLYFKFTPEEMIEKFKILYSGLQKQGAKIYTTPIVYTLFRYGVEDVELIKKVNDWIESYSRENNFTYIDLNKIMALGDYINHNLSFDGLHYTFKANKIIEETFFEITNN